jgi:large subunit ribosomal protein L25
MEQKTLTIEERKIESKGTNRRLRRMGKIPAVIYGHNKPLHISIDEHEFITKFKDIPENIIINMILGEKKIDVLVKDYQEDLIKGKIIHLDFYEIEKGKLLRTRVPVHLTGTAIGVKEGGLLEHLLHDVEVECLPGDLPEDILIDITELRMHHPIHIKDIPSLKGVKFINPEDQVVCLIVAKAAVIEEVKEEEAAEEVAEGEAAEEAGEGEADKDKAKTKAKEVTEE